MELFLVSSIGPLGFLGLLQNLSQTVSAVDTSLVVRQAAQYDGDVGRALQKIQTSDYHL